MRKPLLRIVLLLGMGLAQLSGAQMTPEQIEDLLQNARRSKIELALHQENKTKPAD